MPTRSDTDLMALFNQAYRDASVANNPGTLAQNRPTVDQMSVRDRLWDSMNFTYGQQRRASDQSFTNAISQQDRQALARGMQRSSYNAATQANMRNQQIQAQNDIWAQQIADYERQLYQIDRDEIADQQWERQFAENVRQFNVLHPQPAEGAGGGSGGGATSRRRSSGRGGGGNGGGNGAGDTGANDTAANLSLQDLVASLLNGNGNGTVGYTGGTPTSRYANRVSGNDAGDVAVGSNSTTRRTRYTR